MNQQQSLDELEKLHRRRIFSIRRKKIGYDMVKQEELILQILAHHTIDNPIQSTDIHEITNIPKVALYYRLAEMRKANKLCSYVKKHTRYYYSCYSHIHT